MAKPRLQITIRKDLKEWLDGQIKELRFADYSHAVEVAVLELKNKIEKEKNEA
jgi:Arc/MetJ-type ribon-helix-helix transcriptional regulator